MFAVLHLADFSLQAVLRIERDLAGRAVALVDETLRTPVVIACTAEASARGVEQGLTAPQAMARCADVIIRTRQPAAEIDARAGLLAAAFSVSPQVEDTADGTCTMNVSGLPAERREPAVFAALEQLRQLGLAATAGLAATPLLALYAARRAARGERREHPTSNIELPTSNPERGTLNAQRSTLNAQVGRTTDHPRTTNHELPTATRELPTTNYELPTPNHQDGFSWLVAEDPLPMVAAEADRRAGPQKAASSGRTPPDELCVIDAGAERKFLRDLPLAVAEPSLELAVILEGWGVYTLGALTVLSKADVTQRLGPDGLALWERAAGETNRPLRLVSPAQEFAAAMELENEIETLEPLLFILRRFVDRLALELRNAGFVAGEMTLDLSLADETTYSKNFRLPEPTAQEEILFRVLNTHLETLHTEACVDGVTLTLQPVRPLNRQHELFESALRDPHGFAETLARVATVVGADRVGTPVLENTHRADAVRLVTPSPVVPAIEKERVHPPRGLPLRRFRPPLRATVELNGTAPAYVWTSQGAGAVIELAGPWRGSGEWWEAARAWRREEWDVELETGGVYRLMRTPDGWFVEGEYD
jgi:protein ImuB